MGRSEDAPREGPRCPNDHPANENGECTHDGCTYNVAKRHDGWNR